MMKSRVIASSVAVGITVAIWCLAGETERGRSRVARIVGTALSAQGKPVLGVVEIEPVDDQNPATYALVSDTDGSFATEKLPAGRYRLGVDLGVNRQPSEAYGRYYYRGTPNASEATEIEVAPGIPEPRISFTFPKLRPLVKMRGKVVYEDGAPADGVDVLFSPVGGYSTDQLWSESNGEFTNTVYGSVAYRVQSRSTDLSKLRPSARHGEFESDALIIESADLEKPMLLVLHPKKAQTLNHP